jgi:hypothetical protein
MTNPSKPSGSSWLSVAEFLTMAMKVSGKTDAELVDALELDNVSQVAQLRDGSMRMPLSLSALTLPTSCCSRCRSISLRHWRH